jgi:hypothetical protein
MPTIYAMIDTESGGLVGKQRESACAWCAGALLAGDSRDPSAAICAKCI